jgi:hypothetical protein
MFGLNNRHFVITKAAFTARLTFPSILENIY